jgi:phosphoglycolate phosphatase-like HAD superfamily hydrolase
MKKLYVADLNGTLVNTKGLIYDSYRQAGLIPPPDVWGLHWTDWLSRVAGGQAQAREVRNRQSVAYLTAIRTMNLETRLLPAFHILTRLRDEGHGIAVMTSEYGTAAREVLAKINLRVPLVSDLTYDRRLISLRDAAKSYDVTYVDDSLVTIELLRRDQVPAKLVHYHSQIRLELEKEIIDE